MIASLNIVAKTFAKITKTFVGLSATIIATTKRPILILHLEAKYAKTDCKNKIYAKNWVRSTQTAKSQRSKLTLINGRSTMTSTDVVGDVSKGWMMMLALDDVATITSLMMSVGIKADA